MQKWNKLFQQLSSKHSKRNSDFSQTSVQQRNKVPAVVTVNPIKARNQNQHYVKRDGSPALISARDDITVRNTYTRFKDFEYPKTQKPIKLPINDKVRQTLKDQTTETLKLRDETSHSKNKSQSQFQTLSDESSLQSGDDMPRSLNQTLTFKQEASPREPDSTLKLN